jgi:hypothetical protein
MKSKEKTCDKECFKIEEAARQLKEELDKRVKILVGYMQKKRWRI